MDKVAYVRPHAFPKLITGFRLHFVKKLTHESREVNLILVFTSSEQILIRREQQKRTSPTFRQHANVQMQYTRHNKYLLKIHSFHSKRRRPLIQNSSLQIAM
jgi:hypothetical protein